MKNRYRGGIAEKGGLGQFTDLRRDLARKRGRGGFVAPMHTMAEKIKFKGLRKFKERSKNIFPRVAKIQGRTWNP